MSKTKLTPDQVRDLELIGTEMALSGYPMKWDTLRCIGERFYGSDEPETIRRLVEKARAEGRPDIDVFREFYGWPTPPGKLFN